MEDKNLSYIASEFELGDMSTLDQYQRSIVKVIGVGGGGINAANQMVFTLRTSTLLSSILIVSNSMNRQFLIVCFWSQYLDMMPAM